MNDSNVTGQNAEPEKHGGEPTELEKCMAERDEYLNGWKRAKADLVNYQRDEAKRFEDVVRFGTAEAVRDLIPVLDSFDLAISALEREGKAEKGFYMIRVQLEDALRKRGLDRMELAPGTPFDPIRHEAVGEIESGEPPGSVGEVVERGYLFGGKVLRPARVRLAKSKQ